jgi:hypothetical protein
MSREPQRDEAGRRLEAFLRRDLAAAENDGPGSDEVAAYVDGLLDADDRALFEERLSADPALQDEVRDLRALRDLLRRETRVGRRRAAWTGLAVAAGLGAILLWRGALQPAGPNQVDRSAPAAPVLTLRDANRVLTLRADGSFDGWPGLRAEDRKAVVAALREGRLPQPAALEALRGVRSTLMGGGATARLRVLEPVATFVRSQRPAFRWTRFPGAQGYELVVLGEDLAAVATVRVSGATEAVLDSPLERGRTYVWQVAAVTPGGRVVAPAPPEPEARFRVLGAAEFTALEGELAGAEGADVVSGVLLARAGVRSEAELRLARAAAANPGSAELGRLLEVVRPAR